MHQFKGDTKPDQNLAQFLAEIVDEEEDADEEDISLFPNSRNDSSRNQEKQTNQEPSGKENSNIARSELPPEFHKGKRTLNKIVYHYFNQLKQEYIRTINLQHSKDSLQVQTKRKPFFLQQNGELCRIQINQKCIEGILEAIRKYVGIRHQPAKDIVSLDFTRINQLQKKINSEMRNGSFCYMQEVRKIINCNRNGKINEIVLEAQQGQDITLPNMATPVPFKDTIYFLDPINFNKHSRAFQPDKFCYKINSKGKLSKISRQPTRHRMKCGIIRNQETIYLLGGIVGPNKQVTSSCEKFSPEKEEFQFLPNMLQKHVCPSACILNRQVWVFSQNGIEYLDLKQELWTIVRIPFGLQLFPFQFVTAINQKEVLILGGLHNHRKLSSIQLYNSEMNWAEDFGEILPQPICRERVWGPSTMDMNLMLMANVQAQVYPQVGIKKSAVQIIYVSSNGVYLDRILTS